MRTGIIIALVAPLWAGSAAAGCVSSPVTDVSANAGQDQKLYSYYTGVGWSQAPETMPSWMRVRRRDSDWGQDALDFWGTPRSGTYTVSIRYTRGQESVVCTSRLRFK